MKHLLEKLSPASRQPAQSDAARGAMPAARNVPMPSSRELDPVGTDANRSQRLTAARHRAAAVRGALLQEDHHSLPPLPTPSRRRYGTALSFVICVILPIACAVPYFGFIASPQYVAEFKFSVKDSSGNANQNPGGVLAAVGGGLGVASENYFVVDYLLSRQAIDDLQKRIRVTALYAKSNIDWWSRYDSSQPMEKFVSYWKGMVSSHYDQVTGIASARVRAFSPEDAFLIANTMVSLAEALVNGISNRTRSDAVRFAEMEVEKAQQRMRAVRMRLTETPKARPAGDNGTQNGLLLDLERQTAQSMLASAMQALDQARANAAAQHLYITPYIRPSLPQSSTYPGFIAPVATVGGLAFALWLFGLLIMRSIFERF